jgi:putative tricarboxylic transport membrane protein
LKQKEFLFALFILLAAVIYEVMALRMPRGNISYPGPGFYPSLVGVFLLFTSGSFVLSTLLKGKAQKTAPGSGEVGAVESKTIHRGRTLLLIALLLFYVSTLNLLGFLLAISIFLILSIRIFGYRRWLPALGMTAAIVAISYFSFVVWLKVPLPQGIVGDLLEGLLG